MAKSKTMTRRKASPKPIHQPDGVPRLSVMALILSVTEAYVYPGSRTGVDVGSSCSFWAGGVALSSLMRQTSSLPLPEGDLTGGGIFHTTLHSATPPPSGGRMEGGPQRPACAAMCLSPLGFPPPCLPPLGEVNAVQVMP